MLLKIFCSYALIQVLQKAKATLSRKEREQDGISQSLVPPCEQQASSKGQLGFPPAQRSFPQGNHVPQRQQPLPPGAYRRTSQLCSSQCGCAKIAGTQQYRLVLLCIGWERRRMELRLCSQGSTLPPYLLSDTTRTDHCFVAVITKRNSTQLGC